MVNRLQRYNFYDKRLADQSELLLLIQGIGGRDHMLFPDYLSDIPFSITYDINHANAVEQLASPRCHFVYS